MQQQTRQDPRAYVSVNGTFQPDGGFVPLVIILDDEPYEIDRVLNVCPAASLKAGGAGMRYTVRIRGRETYLFQSGEDGRWFVERR